MYYRKYRPQTIAELDNRQIRETLGKALLGNHFSHAYLFIGPRGTGKTSAARILAKIVNCQKRSKGEEPCNRCTSCVTISKGNSLDVIEIDAASNTGVDDIRDLREKVKLAPTSSPYKVYIIDEVHMLSTSAFNALLKTLEEPPAHVIFVLATTDPQKLPQTIVSRCLVYDFGKVSQEELVGSLGRVVRGEKLSVDKEVLLGLAKIASGSFRDAHKILEQLATQSAKLSLEHLDALKSSKIVDLSMELLHLISDQKKSEALRLIEDFAKDNPTKIRDLIGGAVSILRDVLLFRNGIEVKVEDLNISDEEIFKLVDDLTSAAVLARDCPVPQLPLETVIIEFCKVTTDVTDIADATDNSDKMSKKSVKSVISGMSDVTWEKILSAIKPLNHSLLALLHGSRPRSVEGEFLTLEVFYKFHKDRLEEPKNRSVLEKVVSDIMGKDLKVKFILGGEKHGNV